MTDLIKNIADRLKDRYGAKEVILFGSYARGDQHEDSDIDLFVISETEEKYFERQASIRRLIRDLKKGFAVSPIVLTPEEVNARCNAGDLFVEEILQAGIRV